MNNNMEKSKSRDRRYRYKAKTESIEDWTRESVYSRYLTLEQRIYAMEFYKELTQ